jgi:hypothetical protein
MSTFAEVTLLSHGHGGAGWEIGTCLWSPAVTSSGQDRYAIMREPARGDAVFHWVAGVQPAKPRRRFLWGRSRVARSAMTTNTEPPSPGTWGGRSAYYRINLTGFEALTTPPSLDDIEDGLFDLILSEVLADRAKHYPYVRYREGFRVAQGIYLTRLSPRLAEAMEEMFGGAQAPMAPVGGDGAGGHARTFDEGERYRREVNFFRRNPSLRAAAIAAHGCRCSVCGFDFTVHYGALGEAYIEIHHLRPLAERRELIAGVALETTVDDVAPLCANCHRMAHRERPAVPIDRLKEIWGACGARAFSTG